MCPPYSPEMRIKQKSTRGPGRPPEGRCRAEDTKLMKNMWAVDKLVIVRPHPRLTDADMAGNHAFAQDDWDDDHAGPVELIDRVRKGVKPMATVLLRDGDVTRFSERVLDKACQEMGLSCQVVRVRSRAHKPRLVAVVFQPMKTLCKYYPPEETIARYQSAGVTLCKSLFHTPLENFARSLASEDFQADIRLPLVGLCFGYPVQETLCLLGRR